MDQHRKRSLFNEQVEAKFATDGLDFETALVRVNAGGPQNGDHADAAVREGDK